MYKYLFSNCTAYKATVVQDILLLLFLTSECSERVNDDSEEQVEYNNDDEEKVQEVEHHPAYKQWFLK